ncbi:hypothetical protein ONZ43_g691 [Nemania bipapillata]|uniref:Uncharacterized protein n=1 Tax=Nemania bipapillata TaxID=110536 RepID=A0ACC2J797_9PEZI|nr:hypothetical protein ONZ43_g691 [Nemania bipapillata]
METINSIAVSAAKAVWGENRSSSEEPVSGRLGDTSKEPTNANAGNEASTNGITNGDLDGDIAGDAKFAKTTGTAAESHDTPNKPPTDIKASSGAGDSSKEQNDTRPPEDPKTNPETAPTDVNDAEEEGVNEAPKLDGPGPKPIAQVAKENGGDAGNDSTSSVSSADKSKDEINESKEESHESKGTGEKYVKTTGLHADGGDFDATKPGAGREADRLMEEKGMHNPADPSSKSDSGDSSPTSGKKSLGQKIKDKLHRH